MKNQTFAVAVVVALLAGGGIGYTACSSAEHPVTTTSTLTSTLATTVTSLELAGAVAFVNASVPATAWSPSNPTISFLQCGQPQTNGSGWVVLHNSGSVPMNVTALTVYLGNVNFSKFVSEGGHSVQSCTIAPSASLTVDFAFQGPAPANCQGYNLYVWLDEMSYGYAIGFLGGTSCHG